MKKLTTKRFIKYKEDPEILWAKYSEILSNRVSRLLSIQNDIEQQLEEIKDDTSLVIKYKTLEWKSYKINYWLNEIVKVCAWLEAEVLKHVQNKDIEKKVKQKEYRRYIQMLEKKEREDNKLWERARRERDKRVKNKLFNIFSKSSVETLRLLQKIDIIEEQVDEICEDSFRLHFLLNKMKTPDFYDDFDTFAGYHKGSLQ